MCASKHGKGPPYDPSGDGEFRGHARASQSSRPGQGLHNQSEWPEVPPLLCQLPSREGLGLRSRVQGYFKVGPSHVLCLCFVLLVLTALPSIVHVFHVVIPCVRVVFWLLVLHAPFFLLCSLLY